MNNTATSGRIATVSGTSITWGSPTTLAPSAGNYPSPTFLSSTSVLFAYCPYGGSNAGKLVAMVATISGTTITAGTETVLDASPSGDPFGIQAVSATSAIAAYPASSTTYLKSVGMTISGTTITVGTPVTLSAYPVAFGNFDSGPVMAATSSTQALMVTRDGSSFAIGQFLNINGTAVTSSATSSILASSSRAPVVTYLGSNKAAVGYGVSTTFISAKVLTLS
jgi:hypothetical protein